MMFVADRCVQLLLRPKGKRTYTLVCFGRKKHYRVDGSCRHTAAILARCKPGARVKVTPFGGKGPE